MATPLQSILASRYGGRGTPGHARAARRRPGRRCRRPPRSRSSRARGRACGRSPAPALGTLARAYVHDDLDFTGSARRVLAVAESMVGDVAHGHDGFRARLRLWQHQRRSNRANISHHYDVSNAFYRLWLDERMVYSCAYFERDDDDARRRRRSRSSTTSAASSGSTPGERFLDIGCGWGALVLHAAEHYGVRATGITLSQNQYEHVHARDRRARARRPRRGAAARLPRPARGRAATTRSRASACSSTSASRAFPAYFGKIRRVLKPGGFVLNHGITHNELRRRRASAAASATSSRSTCSRAAS